MIKNNIYMTASSVEPINFNGVFGTLKAYAMKPLTLLSEYYSKLLEEKVSVKQTLLLLNAQISFLFAVFPIALSIVVRILFVAWFVYAVMQCKHSGLRTSD
jgi:hypothetical protein